jgi:cytochrome c peroxidase
LFVAAIGVASGCGGGDATSGGPGGNGAARTPWSYSPLVLPAEPADNPTTPEKIVLGRLLFHDPILSSDRATACVTCHSQYWGMGDGLTLGIGVGGMGPSGIGRTGPTRTRRNVPSLWNAAYRTALFWDGRVASLEEQVDTPLFDERELGADPIALLRAIADNAEYTSLFAAAFPDAPAVTPENLARAVASFVRTIVTGDAPYDRYARGDDKALSEREIRGMFLFNELGCSSCHAPPLFGADRFDAVDPAAAARSDDLGRFEVTGEERDRFAFRVPQLRNLSETGPYFHDGHAPSMSGAIREMAAATSGRTLSDDEANALADFIGKGLMDKAHVPERPLSVPSGLPVPADGFVIRRGTPNGQ